MASLAARRAASFDVWPAFSRTGALWGAIQGRIGPESGSAAAFSRTRRSGRWSGMELPGVGSGKERPSVTTLVLPQDISGMSLRIRPARDRG